jgi:hypothetical protein
MINGKIYNRDEPVRTRRYVLFIYEYDYPGGGWSDCLGSSDSFETVQKEAEKKYRR